MRKKVSILSFFFANNLLRVKGKIHEVWRLDHIIDRQGVRDELK